MFAVYQSVRGNKVGIKVGLFVSRSSINYFEH